jgi:hypothetical protein
MTAALDAILDAHGGLDYWRSLSSVDVEMSARGFLFTAKHVPPQHHMHLTISTSTPEAILHDYPEPGLTTELRGADHIEVRNAAGTIVRIRDHPRDAFAGRRRLLYWDALDFGYFCCYAMWNYITLPFLLTGPGFSIDEQSSGPGDATLLKVRFPPGLPTHSPGPQFHFDAAGRLTRHDYTAEVIGSRANGAHFCRDYRQFDGLWLPTRRRVYPKGPGGRPLPFPTLVAIDIHDARPRSA